MHFDTKNYLKSNHTILIYHIEVLLGEQMELLNRCRSHHLQLGFRAHIPESQHFLSNK